MLEKFRDFWETLWDLMKYMRAEKKFWLAPIIIALLVIGLLIVIAEGTAVAPFIYAVF